MKKSYLHAFRQVETSSELQLIGDLLLVEVIKDEEFSKKVKTDDGREARIFFGTDSNQRKDFSFTADKPTFIRILATGEGYYDDEDPEKQQIPLESKPGQICLIASGSVKPFSVFGKLINYGEVQLGLARESDIQARFENEESFGRYFERLNKALEGQV